VSALACIRRPAARDCRFWDALLIVLGVAMDVITYMHRFAAKSVRPSSSY
jgi:hypothetical protein